MAAPVKAPTVVVPLPTRRATIRFAQALAPILAPSDLVLLDGPLGAGKTFFVRALVRALGLDARERVASPTFALVHEHAVGVQRIAHADLYRIEQGSELSQIGLDELRRDGAILLVEWGAAHEAQLGGDACRIALDLGPPRAAHVTASGPRAGALVEALARALDAAHAARRGRGLRPPPPRRA